MLKLKGFHHHPAYSTLHASFCGPYLYTIGGDEKYQYGYVMSKTSPMGPYEAPKDNVITTTDEAAGVYGPGHGSVFRVDDTDDYYFAFLEFGRNSTNRQTYVNRLEFNPDGTIKPVTVDLNGVGALKNVKHPQKIAIDTIYASSVRNPLPIRYFKDPGCRRTESFAPKFAIDGANGSRWMAAPDDASPSITVDLGKVRKVKQSDIYFVRPTAGHNYVLEGSADGKTWQKIGGNESMEIKAPNSDKINKKVRYLRATVVDGEPGVWEWNIY